jgi:hypothetical protein
MQKVNKNVEQESDIEEDFGYGRMQGWGVQARPAGYAQNKLL